MIGNGPVASHEGLVDVQLKHPHHATFHATKVPDAEDKDVTRFYRWHIDAALYDLAPPRVTTLQAVQVPKGRTQTLRYDDGSRDELQVPLGTTAFVSGRTMFDRLSPAEKSLAVRVSCSHSLFLACMRVRHSADYRDASPCRPRSSTRPTPTSG